MKVLTSEELEKKWDEFSKSFQFYNEPCTLPTCFMLITSLGINNQFGSGDNIKNILEIACGAGAGTACCLNYKKDSTKLTSTDISTEMIQLAKKRLGMSQEQDEITNKNFKILKCNAEKLPFEDGSFDRYFSNYCLHLVNSPETMLKESCRVLEKGGVAAFSVWGRKENSNQFTINGLIANELGIDMTPSTRSAFHLSDTTKLREMALNAGFSKCIAAYTSFPAPIQNGEDFVEIFMSPPENQNLLKKIGEEKSKQFRSRIAEHVDELLNKGEFVGQEVAYIICTK